MVYILQIENEQEATIIVKNYLGKTLKSYRRIKNFEIDISNLPNGIYWLEIKVDNYFITKKVVKQ